MPEERVIIRERGNREGRTYSVTRDAHANNPRFADYDIVGGETPESFVATGIPKAKRSRSKPARKPAVTRSARNVDVPVETPATPDAEA